MQSRLDLAVPHALHPWSRADRAWQARGLRLVHDTMWPVINLTVVLFVIKTGCRATYGSG